MAVKVKPVGDVVVVKVKGKLMGGVETSVCHAQVKKLIAEGYSKAVIDLSQVEWVNSMGLGMLIACYTSLINHKGFFKIACATEKTKSLLSMTKLNTVFSCYDTLEAALQSYVENV